MSCKKYNQICDSCGQNDPSQDASCISYTGPALVCSNINSGDDLETAFQKIDEILCSSSGDYSSYNKSCLSSYWPVPITNESIFVNAITNYACKIRSDFDTFTGSTFTTSIDNLTNQVNSIINPNITCTSAGITTSDGISSVLSKYCAKFGDIDDILDLSSVVWNNCSIVPIPPTTIVEGFQLLSDQICSISSSGAVLPTFNNIGSCLEAPLTSSDSLLDTINKIKTRLCLTPTYSATNISWGCVSTPISSTSIEAGLQSVINKVGQITQAFPTFNTSDFSVIATDVGNPCAGVTVSLATPLNQDRLVASTTGDSSPGTLQDKLEEGTNITLDYATTPGKVIINSTGGSGSYEVKGDTSDDDPGFLIDKLNGNGSNGISVDPSYNPTTKKVDLNVNVNVSTLFNLFLDELENNNELYTKFCEKVRNCPSPCSPPTNVQIVQVSVPTTTTTTV